jgi:hypothetical protein
MDLDSVFACRQTEIRIYPNKVVLIKGLEGSKLARSGGSTKN